MMLGSEVSIGINAGEWIIERSIDLLESEVLSGHIEKSSADSNKNN